jgi:uncharacterized protein (DUF39 family)
VIEDLVSGKKVLLKGGGYGTDCYPRKEREQWIGFEEMNDATLFNPRNCYQNYNVAVNLSDKTIYTYMGKLKPRMGNANYCSAGQLSPLLSDPCYRTRHWNPGLSCPGQRYVGLAELSTTRVFST